MSNRTYIVGAGMTPFAKPGTKEGAWQMRGTAGKRQVDGASTALQHNIGLGGAAVVGIYRKPS